MDDAKAVVHRWSERLKAFIPGFFADSPALRLLTDCSAIILHGSTTLGIDDAFSDLDLWVLIPAAKLRQAESIAGTRFFSFNLHGKQGHFNLENADYFKGRVAHCDLECIAEMRTGHVLGDCDGIGSELRSLAQQPMSEAVRRAWFCHHYVEMRAFHRNCDNPIDRGDALAVLQGLVPTLNHALRAAMVLDYQPYPYIKWLGRAAGQTPTGRRLLPLVTDILNHLGSDALHHPGPEGDHPLGIKLREIRAVLVDSARAGGIDEPWLERWWAHLTQAKVGIKDIIWADPPAETTPTLRPACGQPPERC